MWEKIVGLFRCQLPGVMELLHVALIYFLDKIYTSFDFPCLFTVLDLVTVTEKCKKVLFLTYGKTSKVKQQVWIVLGLIYIYLYI